MPCRWRLFYSLYVPPHTVSSKETFFLTQLLFKIQVGILDLPLNFAWLSSLFFLVGDGPTVATTMATTIVADVVPTHLRYCVLLLAKPFQCL